MSEQIAIIGAGNVGCALAGVLTLKGHRVNLFSYPDHTRKIESFRKSKKLALNGYFEGEVILNLITVDMAEALNQAKFIFVTLPSYAQDKAFADMLPHLKEWQTVIFLTGNFATLSALEIMKKNNVKKEIVFAETNTNPYPCRSADKGIVTVMSSKKAMDIAIFPKNKAQKTLKELTELLSCNLLLQQSILNIGLNSPNGVVHPGTAVLNIGRIEGTNGDFYFYKEGMTESVCKILEKIDQDRLAIGKEIGLNLKSLLQMTQEYYGLTYKNILDFAQNTKMHNVLKACPPNIHDRYFIEDIPYVLVPWFCIGDIAGVHSKAIKSIIDLGSIMHGIDFLTMGRNLASMGLNNIKKEQLIAYVREN